jgi:hypothetical protein
MRIELPGFTGSSQWKTKRKLVLKALLKADGAKSITLIVYLILSTVLTNRKY